MKHDSHPLRGVLIYRAGVFDEMRINRPSVEKPTRISSAANLYRRLIMLH